MARKIQLHSPYPPVDLANILKEEMDRKWTKEEKTTGRVLGEGTEADMRLHVARWGQRNDFAAQLKAKMTPDRAGTLISGKLGTARSVGCFMFGWLGFVGMFFLISTFLWPSDEAPLLFKVVFSGIPALMFLAGLAMLIFASRSNPEDAEKIIAFLADKVKAREVQASSR